MLADLVAAPTLVLLTVAEVVGYRLSDQEGVWDVVVQELANGSVPFVLSFGGVGWLLARRLPGSSSLAVAASTLAAAALFQPLRRRVQDLVDSRFNQARYDADRTVDDFRRWLRDEVDLVSVRADLLRVVDGTVQPAAVGLWLPEGAR